MPKGLGLLGHLNEIEGPLRLADIAGHPNSVGFPEGHPPMKTFPGAAVRHPGERLGNIYLTEKEGGQEFSLEDEETLVMFASQAALTVSNARSYRDEQQVRANLESLINTSPVGILIFDAKTGVCGPFPGERCVHSLSRYRAGLELTRTNSSVSPSGLPTRCLGQNLPAKCIPRAAFTCWGLNGSTKLPLRTASRMCRMVSRSGLILRFLFMPLF